MGRRGRRVPDKALVWAVSAAEEVGRVMHAATDASFQGRPPSLLVHFQYTSQTVEGPGLSGAASSPYAPPSFIHYLIHYAIIYHYSRVESVSASGQAHIGNASCIISPGHRTLIPGGGVLPPVTTTLFPLSYS